jgi:predicted adenylyl cyclase CyaB
MKVEVQVRAFIYDFNRIKRKIEEIAEFISEVGKTDYYFDGRFDFQEKELRLRKEGNEKTVSLKIKSFKNTEENKEFRFKVDNASDLIKVFENIGLKVIAMKHKKSLFYNFKDMSIQLVSIKELGDFIEIEKKCSKNEVVKAGEDIIALAESLGIHKEQIEKRSYLRLLTERKPRGNDNEI